MRPVVPVKTIFHTLTPDITNWGQMPIGILKLKMHKMCIFMNSSNKQKSGKNKGSIRMFSDMSKLLWGQFNPKDNRVKHQNLDTKTPYLNYVHI